MQPRETASRPVRTTRTPGGNGKDLPYRVSLDVRGAQRLEIGLDPAGDTRVRYTVPLTGPLDDRWRRAFRLVQLEDTGYFRFRLELMSPAITFTCRETRSAAELSEGIRQLTGLVERVNLTASKIPY